MTAPHEQNGLGLAAMAGCAFCWSLAGLLIGYIDWNPFAIAAGRSAVAGLFLLAWVRRPRFTFSRVQIGAGVASAATMILFIYANKATTSANAILLQFSAPIYTGFLGTWLLKERTRVEHWVAFGAVAVGMALFFFEDLGQGALIGNLAAVASGVTFAFYVVLMRKQKEGSPLESALLANLFGATVAGAMALTQPLPALSWPAVSALLALGVVQIGVATVLFAYGIKRVTAVQSVIVAGLEPVFNPLWVFLVVGQAPSPLALLGGAVILAAVVGQSLWSLKGRGRGETGRAALASGSHLARRSHLNRAR